MINVTTHPNTTYINAKRASWFTILRRNNCPYLPCYVVSASTLWWPALAMIYVACVSVSAVLAQTFYYFGSGIGKPPTRTARGVQELHANIRAKIQREMKCDGNEQRASQRKAHRRRQALNGGTSENTASVQYTRSVRMANMTSEKQPEIKSHDLL